MNTTRFLILAAAPLLCLGCQTTRTSSGTAADAGPVDASPRVTLLAEEARPLSDTLRQVALESGGSVVMMHGVGEKVIPPFAYKRRPFDSVMEEFAGAVGCVVSQEDGYFFLYPESYEVLKETMVQGKLHARYEEIRLDLAIGDYTPFFDALALVGHSLGITVIADNLLAESRCGEIAFHDAPLSTVLSGLLRSARVAPEAFFVESTEEYILLGTVGHKTPPSLLLNRSSLSETAKAYLAKEVTLTLPRAIPAGQPLPFRWTAEPLETMLNTLSSQLGVRVSADARLRDLPVNPCAMSKVSLETAMNLLIRQWPMDRFGYEALEDGILIRSAEPLPSSPDAHGE